jgi:hypothetical protein
MSTLSRTDAPIDHTPLLIVSRVLSLLDSDEVLAGAELGLPRTGTSSDTYGMTFEGWAVGRNSPANAVLVSGRGYPERSLPVSVRRPDLRRSFEGIEWAPNAGFRGAISSLRLPEKFELDVVMRLRDGTRAPLARVIGHRRLFAPGDDSLVRPIVITTLGRTGSTWATALLGSHPRVVAFRPYTYEPRVATYWADVLAGLSEPRSYGQAISGEVYGWDWWTGEGRISSLEEMISDPDIERFLGTRNIEALAAFCRGRIAAFYEEVSRARNVTPDYFVEKTSPDSGAPMMLRHFYPGTREVFLVRDLRDVAASTLAYNAKRGITAFGRETVESDEDYIRGPLRRDAQDLLEAWRDRAEDAYLLRYETLIEQPHETLAGLFSYLAIESDEDTIAETLHRAHRPLAQKQHQTSDSARESIGRWKTDLPEHLQRACDEALGEMLVEFGYQR